MAAWPPGLSAWRDRLLGFDFSPLLRTAYQVEVANRGAPPFVIAPQPGVKYMLLTHVPLQLAMNGGDAITRMIQGQVMQTAADMLWQVSVDVTRLTMRVEEVSISAAGPIETLNLVFTIAEANAPQAR